MLANIIFPRWRPDRRTQCIVVLERRKYLYLWLRNNNIAVCWLAPYHHLKRTRYVHHVFLLAGSILKLEASEVHQASAGPCPKVNWDAAMRLSSKQYAFWSLVMDLEMLLCRFVRSLRDGYFDLYVQVIDELCGWLFIFDQTHYSR